ncbi:cupin domain-containing protein [Mesorhizobium sp. dw_380]|uniref:cupin domain-containing protein n=1 Tax=Mesorhizobium sp. dw_380 TaxID=2812001 RepID=UPI00332ADB60
MRSLFQSPDGTIDVGIWECTPGRFTADRSGSSEICHIIWGRLEVSRADGETCELRPVDLLVLPQGWKGEWRISETTRKLYMIQSAG